MKMGKFHKVKHDIVIFLPIHFVFRVRKRSFLISLFSDGFSFILLLLQLQPY